MVERMYIINSKGHHFFLMPVIFMNKRQPNVAEGVLDLKETMTVIPFNALTNHVILHT